MKRLSFTCLLIFFLSVAIISGVATAGDLHLTEPLQNGPYAADGNITAESNCVIGPDRIVLFSAAGTISLKPGFHAQAGSTFSAVSGKYGNLDDSTDADGDRLADWWEVALFGNLDQGPDDDPDGDSITNIKAFCQRLYPNIPAPQIAFGADPQLTNGKNPTRLYWTVLNADSIAIEPGLGDVTGNSFVDVIPTSTTEYKIIATGICGVAEKTFTVVVDRQPPEILSFYPLESDMVSKQELQAGILATFTDNTGIGTVSIVKSDGGSETDMTSFANIDNNSIHLDISDLPNGNHRFKLILTDTVGNETIQQFVFKVDNIMPVTTPSVQAGSFSHAFDLNLSCSKEATIFYSTDGSPPFEGSPNTFSRPAPITGIVIDRNMNLQYFAVDNAGNIESVKSSVYRLAELPEAVAGLKATYSAPNVNLTWDKASSALSYRVYRAHNKIDIDILSASQKGLYAPPERLRYSKFDLSPETPVFSDSEIVPGISYYYGVTQVNQENIEGLLCNLVTPGPIPGTNPATYREQAIVRAQVWLESTQGRDGSWGEKENRRILATTQILNGFNLAGQNSPAIQKALFYLRGQFADNNDYLARKILALDDFGQNTNALFNRLISQRTLSGYNRYGWGVQKKFRVDAATTALGYLASTRSPVVLTPYQNGYASLAEDCDLWNHPDRYGWILGQGESIFVSSLAYSALYNHKLYPNLDEKDYNWILTSQNEDGSFGNGLIDTAGVLLWFHNKLSFEKNYGAAKFIVSQQEPDGSWADDHYLTGLCLSALLALKPELGSFIPSDSLWVSESAITFSGSMIGEFSSIEINGIPAEISEDRFSIKNYHLSAGQNAIQVVGIDSGGVEHKKTVYISHTTPTLLFVDPAGDDSGPCSSPGTGACASIKAAITKASIGNYDTIYIAPGTYHESAILPSKSLTLLGAVSPSKPEIRPSGELDGALFNIEGQLIVNFKNLFFNVNDQNIQSAIHFKSSNSSGRIEGCVFWGKNSNSSNESFVISAGSITAENNSIENCLGSGIFMLHSNNNTIENNQFSNSKYGIELFDSSNNTIRNNQFDKCIMGIRLGFQSTGNLIANNSYSACEYDTYQKSAIGITSPSYGVELSKNPISVTGSILDGNNIKSVNVNGVQAPIEDNTFTAEGVILVEGSNDILAVGIDVDGAEHTDIVKAVYVPKPFLYVSPLGDDSKACTSPGTGACSSIKAAVSKAANADADTIYVASGTYVEEQILVPKSLSFIGETSPSKPVIKSATIGDIFYRWFQFSGNAFSEIKFENLVFEGSAESGFTFLFEFTEIDGKSVFKQCDFKNTQTGIEFHGGSHKVSECSFENVQRGISLYSSAELLVNNCTFKGSFTGGELYKNYFMPIVSNDSILTAEYNTFIDVGTGIWNRSNSSIIRYNIFNNCYNGIDFPVQMFQPSLNNAFSHNSFADCIHGIYIDNRAVRTVSKSNAIENNSFINNEIGILFRADNSGFTFTLAGNTFENSISHDVYIQP